MMSLPVEQLQSRAKSLVAKFEQGDGTSYLDEAIVLDREALELCQSGHGMRPASLDWLAIDLWRRYRQLGVMSDLTESIVLAREALDLCLPGHINRTMSLNNLGICLCARYQQLGTFDHSTFITPTYKCPQEPHFVTCNRRVLGLSSKPCTCACD
ncbi:hypothetical protein OG21DRAFT_1022936 [Imleria badia]|nr:hypothetical protein OG21DRAFT_1022936 [Imleria badia]